MKNAFDFLCSFKDSRKFYILCNAGCGLEYVSSFPKNIIHTSRGNKIFFSTKKKKKKKKKIKRNFKLVK